MLKILKIFFIFVLLTGCSEEQIPLRVGTNIWIGYEPLYVAREQGYFSDDDIQMVELLSASDVMTAFREGMIDVAALTLDEAISLLAEGFPLHVFLIMDISEGADSLVARENIAGLEDLKGKTIGVEQTAVGAVMLDGALQKAGLQLSDVDIRHLTADEHVMAFNEGSVDAVVTFEPSTSMLLKAGAQVVFDSNDIPGRIIDVLVVRPEVRNSHKQQLYLLADSHFKALEYINSSPAKASEIMTMRMQVPADEVMLMFDGLVLPERARNLQLFADNARVLQKSANTLADILNRSGLINRVINTTTLFDSTFVKQP